MGAALRPAWNSHGEIFIDDAQGHIPNRAYVPDMVGGLVGIDLPKLPWNLRFGANIEYVAIANFVYSHRNPNNDYVYRGVMLGHPLGPDSDMLVLTLSYCPDKCAKLTLGVVERHGEGRAAVMVAPARAGGLVSFRGCGDLRQGCVWRARTCPYGASYGQLRICDQIQQRQELGSRLTSGI